MLRYNPIVYLLVEIRTVAGPIERPAVRVHRRPVHRLVACVARPCGVPAAVTQAGFVSHQDSVRAEKVADGAAGGRLCHPLPVSRPDKLSLHT